MPRTSLAQVQVDSDKQRLSRDKALLERKWTRMAASPFAFLRGASVLWAAALEREPELLADFPGEGPVVGDLHLENFGTFRTQSGFTFHVNDFDETFTGPWAFDVLRLLTSTLLARPELGATGTQVLSLAEGVLEGYGVAMVRGQVKRPSSIEALVKKAAGESQDKLLGKRLDGDKLKRDEKTPAAPVAVKREVESTVADWLKTLSSAEKVEQQCAEVLDVTRRVAGTGSLGVERLLVLTRGEAKQPWLVEVKEVRGSAFSDAPPSAESLVETMRRALPEAPLRVGAAKLDDVPVVVKPVLAGEDKLSADDYDRTQLPDIFRYLGFLMGEVHRRGAGRAWQWTDKHRQRALDNAGHLTGLHEQAFLEFCRLVR